MSVQTEARSGRTSPALPGRSSPALSVHGGDGGGGCASRPANNKEVKLDELSKYFHLPEKAVAKELGICLTSLKKLCRSYGITRWPFHKLNMAVSKTQELGAYYAQAASTALANVARVQQGGLLSRDSNGDDMSPPITAQVTGNYLLIINWSTLWSQPQLKGKLLLPLGGTSLKVSGDGVRAELEFANEDTAARALRICRLAEAQALGTNQVEGLSFSCSATSAQATASAPTNSAHNGTGIGIGIGIGSQGQGCQNGQLAAWMPQYLHYHQQNAGGGHMAAPAHLPAQPMSVISGLLADSAAESQIGNGGWGGGHGTSFHMGMPGSMCGMPLSHLHIPSPSSQLHMQMPSSLLAPSVYSGMHLNAPSTAQQAMHSNDWGAGHGQGQGQGQGSSNAPPSSLHTHAHLHQPLSSGAHHGHGLSSLHQPPSAFPGLAELKEPQSSHPGLLAGPISALFPGMFSSQSSAENGAGEAPDSLSSFMAK